MKKLKILLMAACLLPVIFLSCSPTPSITANVVLSTQMTDMKQIYSAEMAGENVPTNSYLELAAGTTFFDFNDYYNRIDINYIKASSLNAMNDEDDEDLVYSYFLSDADNGAYLLFNADTVKTFPSLVEMKQYAADQGYRIDWDYDPDETYSDSDYDVATYPDSLKGTTWEGSYYYGSILVTDTLDFQTDTFCLGTTSAGGDSVNTNITYTYNSSSKSGTLTADSSASYYIIDDKLYFNSVTYFRIK